MTLNRSQFRKFFYLFFIILFILLRTALSTDPQFEACKPKTCGNNVNISFPFWIDTQPSYCGYPGFHLTCKNNESILDMSKNNDYYIRDIFYTNQSISVLSVGSLDNNCPRLFHNLTLDRTPFHLTPSTLNVSFFLNCTHLPPQTYIYFKISSCVPTETRYSFATFEEYGGLGCESMVIAPIRADAVPLFPGYLDGYSEFMKKGFVLEWTANNCSICAKSGGRCGFNGTSQFVCFCPDRPHLKSCTPRSVGTHKSEETKGIIIGVSTGVLVVLICIISLFCWCCRKRLRSKSSTLLSQNKFSDPSSRHDLEKCNSNFFGTPVFTYKELEEATENFAESRELGDGGFGTVYYGKLRDGRSVAVKRLYENNYKRVEQFMNEVEILSRVRHHNLVSLYGCTSRHSRELLLVYEFVPNGTVADHLHGERAQSGPLTWPIRMSIAIETAGALAYLHAVEPQIIHRDVKTNNILLDNNFQVKVADFGLSRLFPTDVTHVSTAPQGTPGYVDPDYHHCYQLTDKSDVYSFGVVLVELISSKPAVDITRNRHEINLAKMAINKIHNHALHEFVDMGLGFETDYGVRRMITLVAELAFRCLQEDREVRPSMEEVLEVLRGIESDDFPAKKAEDIDVPSDDVGLLNGIPPASPDTVMDTWASRTTTPNTSG
ncbi:LEAF RUST 10 DISEASE-RESISTANCE LOCUS RECEPTOR-LIKE PROTEIN KINASE-like 1.2 isoform X4 [Tasmannia lanceolata]|uniref:LEAF RUST 10 DISEASE-RESISTANCE LOCUS RECEPTOR-LIKE PROTEIN KINASE-like 1.2 isoform X4 n=1 Tax=Tasmannia lanceolata TaxID=3420 RepID=UPI0040634B5E